MYIVWGGSCLEHVGVFLYFVFRGIRVLLVSLLIVISGRGHQNQTDKIVVLKLHEGSHKRQVPGVLSGDLALWA